MPADLNEPLLDPRDSSSSSNSSRGDAVVSFRQHPGQQHAPIIPQAHVCSTFWPCVLNMTKAITGAGMLAIPRAFVQVGWLAGTAMLLLVGLLSWLTMVVLVRGASQHGCSTYAGLVATVFQHRSRRTKLMFLPLQLSIVGFCLGFSVVHLVTVRDVLVDLLREVCGAAASAAGPLIRQVATGAIEPRPFDPRLLIIAVAACVCAPALLTIRSLDRLRVTNSLGVAASALLAAAAGSLGLVAAARGRAHAIPMLPAWRALGPTRGTQLEALTDVLPVLLACYVAHQNVFPMLPLLQPYSCGRASRVIAVALAISGSMFLMLSVGAAAAFGPDSLAVNCLDNMSVDQLAPLLGWHAGAVALSWTLRLGVAVSVLATLLLFMWPLRAGLAEMLWPDPDGAAAVAGTAAGSAAAACLSSRCAAATASRHHYLQQQLEQPLEADPLPAQVPQQQQQQQPGMHQVQQSCMQLWPALERQNYVPLTLGLLAVMTLLAATTTNIFEAVSVVGDLAGTTQAFIYPGILVCAGHAVHVHGGPWRARTQAAAAACIVALGVVLFCNGVISRLLASISDG